MSGASDISISTVRRESIQFELGGVGKSMVLNCPGRDCASIAVQVLTDRQPLVRKSSCFCCKPKWVVIDVMVAGRSQSLLIKVKDVAVKWGIAESLVRRKCDDGDFEELVPKVVEPSRSSFSVPSATTTGSTVSVVEDADGKEDSEPHFLASPSFFQFVRFLGEPKNKDKYTEVLVELKNHWPRLQGRIKKEIRSWQRQCQQEQLPNLPIGDAGFPLEYFCGDKSTWLHMKLDSKRFAINLSTGEFYRFKIIAKNQYLLAYQRIEKIAGRVETVRVSEFQLKNSKSYRLLSPYFLISLEQAVKEGIIIPENQHQYIREWTAGLKALHQAGVLHGDIGSSLLLECSPNLESHRPVIGGFRTPTVPKDEDRDALMAQEFALFEKRLQQLYPT